MDSRTLGMKLGAALADLALGCTSPDDVAQRLKRRGCEGPRSDCGGCPVWIYLARDLGSGWKAIQIDPDADTMTVNRDEAAISTWDGLDARRPMPAVIAEFIDRFDADCYPELIKEA